MISEVPPKLIIPEFYVPFLALTLITMQTYLEVRNRGKMLVTALKEGAAGAALPGPLQPLLMLHMCSVE